MHEDDIIATPRLAIRTPLILAVILLLIGALATAFWLTPTKHVPSLVLHLPEQGADRHRPPLPVLPVPEAAPDIAPEAARRINAAMPFSTRPNRAARPFAFTGSAMERESALTCLASAAWYEAGDDSTGQQAVVQVVLNRVRHPAFAKTICGVVFEGAERRTGCQFTFTCDGALARTPSAAAWQRARAVATQALGGFVYAQVGTATHYHTNWVVPYWAATLDKITEIHTHIFYRWEGWWGEPGAFASRYQSGERIPARIAYLANSAGLPLLDTVTPAHDESVTSPKALPLLSIAGVSPADLKGSRVQLADEEGGTFVLQLNPDAYPGSYAITANAICKRQPKCVVMGWTKASYVPRALPVMSSQMLTATFMYRRNKTTNVEEVWWNCKVIPRDIPTQCRPGTEPDGA